MPFAPVPPVGMPVPAMPPTPRPEPGTRLRPAPRQLPERPGIPPIEPRHRTDDETLKRPQPPHPRRGGPARFAARLTVAALFLAAVVATIFFSLYYFLPDGPGQRMAKTAAPLVIPPRAPDAVVAEEPTPLTIPAPDDIGALLSEVGANIPPPPPPVDEPPEPATLAAGRVLEAFLFAPDAASRMPLVEPAAKEEELGEGVLASPLPPITKIEPDSPRFHEAENLTEFPFAVIFQPREGPPFQCTVMVRRSGTQEPKVLLPAFLDLMPGGRLAGFAAEPGPGLGTFHVVLEARPGCYDEGIPMPERKFTFRLLPSPFSPEIARAYVADNSRFRKMLEDPESSLRWGTRIRATVTLQWNRSEDPEKPYLEVVDIRALDWNP